MADKHIWEIESASTMSDEDRLLIVIGTSEFLISKSDFKKALGGLSSVDTAKLSKIIIDGDGSRVLANNGEYISLNDLYEDKHNHSNKTILDKFTINAETNELMYNGVIVGSNYELPIATSDTLGGVKIDGDTIKINDGIISADVVGNWVAGNTYPVGYFVSYNNAWYQCVTANSDTQWTAANWTLVADVTQYSAYLQAFMSSVANMMGTTIYSTGSVTNANDTGLLMTKGGLNSSNFILGVVAGGTPFGIKFMANSNNGYWQANATVDIIAPWEAAKAYKANYYVTYENKLYQCITEHTSGDTFDKTYWFLIGGSGGGTLSIWEANTDYVVGSIVVNDTTIYQCNTEHTSGEAFDETESANWTVLTGEKGDKGDDGISPTVSVEQTDTGCTVTVTDASGTTTANLTNGTDGNDGKSAYELAVQNGYTGTEEEWLTSLKGTDGVTTVQTTKIDKTCIFTADGWSDVVPYTQTVAVEGITESLNPRIDLIVSDNVATGKKEEIAFSYFTKAITGNGILTAYCYETKPDVDLNIMIEVI